MDQGQMIENGGYVQRRGCKTTIKMLRERMMV
jgi:hypothetical protein